MPNGSKVRAVVFDLDGTLADSAPDITSALNLALDGIGLAPFPIESVKEMVGGGARRLVERALTRAVGSVDPELARVVLEGFGSAYTAAPCVETRLFANAREVLQDVRARGYRTGVCTNKPERATAAVLACLGVDPLIDKVVGGSSLYALKPAPDMLLAVLDGLGASPREAVMVGDSAADVGAAKAAGVRCILVGHGYTTTPVSELGGDLVIEGFHQLADALEALGAV